MRKGLLNLILLILSAHFSIHAQIAFPTDTADSDTTEVPADSLSADSTQQKRQSILEYDVDYSAEDSMLIDMINQRVYLYGAAVASYGDIKLSADYIEIALNSSELYATGLPDSNGNMAGLPEFKQGAQEFRSREMRYNFKTKRGLSTTVKTEESDGYIHGEKVKKQADDVLYIRHGKYTTCELDTPHFYIAASKLKVIPKEKIITGPAYLTIEEIPTPLAIPFGLFPNTPERANGIVLPSYGDNRALGFSLNGGGYYFGINDVAEFSLLGDIYTRGSWAGYLRNGYRKRYKFNGGVDLEYVVTKQSLEEYPDFNRRESFGVRWRHSQDPKANPNSTFSADVNVATSNNFRNNIQSSTNDYLQTNLASSIRYSNALAGTPFRTSISATHRQNLQTGEINVQLPNINVGMNPVYPFKRKNPVGKERWYERVNLSYSSDIKNSIDAGDSVIFEPETLKEMRNGVRHQSGLQTNFKILRYFSINPSINYREVWYLQTFEQQWDEQDSAVVSMRNTGFDRFGEASASIGLSTNIYGMYTYKSEIIKAIRHTMTPRISLSYKPDYSDDFWGYFEPVQVDTNGTIDRYTRFDGGLFGGPSASENGVINIGLQNTLEMKVRNLNDSTGKDKKIKIFEGFNFNTSYNLAKDSLRWNPVAVTVRTQLIKGVNIQGNATLDPYALNAEQTRTVNAYEFQRTGNLARITRANAAISFNLKSKSRDKSKSSEEKKERLNQQNMDYDQYTDFDIPWSVRVNYNLGYSKPLTEASINQTLDLTGEVNITRSWRLQGRTGFDFDTKKITYSQFTLFRDLHCWQFSLNVVPSGPRQSYNFTIGVKPGMLQDLKLNRRRNFSVPQD